MKRAFEAGDAIATRSAPEHREGLGNGKPVLIDALRIDIASAAPGREA